MVTRRPPRAMWAPSLVWPPLMMAGVWWMMGMRWRSTSVGHREWFVGVVLPAPSGWLQSPAAYVGAAVLLLGIAAWWVSFTRPDATRRLVVARFPEFAMAGHLLLVMAALSVFDLEAHVFDIDSMGLQWRAIATVRPTPDLIVAGCLAAGAALCHVLSFGSPRRLPRSRIAS